MSRAAVRTIAALLLPLAAAASARAIERGPLPVFELQTAGGRATTSDRLVHPGPWLIIVVRPQCPPCAAVLRSLAAAEQPAVRERTVIISLGDRAALSEWTGRFPAAAGAQWFADGSGAAAAALKVENAPLIFGLRDRTIEWSVGGVFSDSADIRSIASSWIAGASR